MTTHTTDSQPLRHYTIVPPGAYYWNASWSLATTNTKFTLVPASPLENFTRALERLNEALAKL